MLKPLIGLLLGSLLALAAAALYAGDSRAPVYGLALTLPPAMLSLGLVLVVGGRWPPAGPTAVLVGTGLRMGWVVAAVSVLGPAVVTVGIPRQSLADWACGFYLVTLALETGLLWGRLDRTGRAPA